MKDIKYFIRNIKVNIRTLSSEDYINQLPMKEFSYTSELINEIQSARKDRDEGLLENILVVATRDGLNDKYTEELCATLKGDWTYIYEEIVVMLEEIKDPASIPTLYETALRIPEHDDGRSLAKKCIWALVAINTPESKIKIVELSKHNDWIISEAAIIGLKG